jgi:adenylyltransferase/sulfurtransferase
MLPGLVGMVLATEALKLIISDDSALEGKLLTYDGRKCEFKKMSLRKKKPDCMGCG